VTVAIDLACFGNNTSLTMRMRMGKMEVGAKSNTVARNKKQTRIKFQPLTCQNG
jgi:hypothetical protein